MRIKDCFDEIIKHKNILFLNFQAQINLGSSYYAGPGSCTNKISVGGED